jgi:hypothetical protein
VAALTLLLAPPVKSNGQDYVAVPLFSGTTLPVPPQQSAPWTPAPTACPETFIAAARMLFEQGLPDPRECEYRKILVGGWRRELFAGPVGLVPADDLMVSGGLQRANESRGWVLPGQPGERQRFAIRWDGLIYPVVSVGRPEELRPDAERLIEADEGRVPQANLLRACLLLRAGEGALAERALSASRGGWGRGPVYRALAGNWLDNLMSGAARDHMRGDDRLALVRLRHLAAAFPSVARESARLGAEEAEKMPGATQKEWVLALLADQERRAGEGDRRPLPPAKLRRLAPARRRIAALIHELDQANIQAQPLDNPGVPELWNEPRVRALTKEGAAAVETLLDCVERDTRLTRSASYWRFGWPSGEMVPVRDAAYEALRGILGREALNEIERHVSYQNPGLVDADCRKKLIPAIRTYWREHSAARTPHTPRSEVPRRSLEG